MHSELVVLYDQEELSSGTECREELNGGFIVANRLERVGGVVEHWVPLVVHAQNIR
jgi:hypothetical protein